MDNGKDDNPYTDTSAKGQEADSFAKTQTKRSQPPPVDRAGCRRNAAVKTNKAAPNN